MSIRKQLIKDALILTPAIYMLAIWIYFLSPRASVETAPAYLGLAALLAFGVAYSVRLFIAAFSGKGD